MKLADMNDVRPALLLGFLHEAGPTELIEQDAKGEVSYPWADCYRDAAAFEKRRKARSNQRKADDDKGDWRDAGQGHGEAEDDDDPWLHDANAW